MVLVFDIGTSVVKGGIFDLSGCPLQKASRRVELLQGETSLCHEVAPSEWVRAITGICTELGTAVRKDIRGIVISGNGPTLVSASADGTPLGNAMTWMDRRGVEEAELIKTASGMYVDPTFYLPKALWLKRHRPDLFEKTTWFLACPEYMGYFLTGNAVTVLPGDHFLRYFWTDDLLSKLDFDGSLFPPFVKPGTLIGNVSAAASKTVGIAEGIPVISGGPDFVMSLLGAASVSPGRACVRSGTSEGMNLCWSAPVKDDRLMCYGHVVDGLFNISGIISTSGKALEWFKDGVGNTGAVYEDVFKDIEATPPGAGGLLFLPYLTGERAPLWDPHARGAFIGLNLSHNRCHMARAVAESVGFAIRDVIEVMEEDGLTIEDLRITGRPSKNALWNQIKADISGRRILLPEQEDPELSGDACIALAYLGEFAGLVEASENVVSFKQVFSPRKEYAAVYNDLFSLYRDSYRGLKDVFKRISNLNQQGE